MSEDRAELRVFDAGLSALLKEYGFAALVGILLLLNLSGLFQTLFGLDTAILIALLAGYKTFHNSISALLEKRISADLALCIAVIAALSVGQYLAAAEAMFIVMVGEGLESFAAGRTDAAIHRLVERMPRVATRLRDGREEQVPADSLAPGDRIVVRAGERIPIDGKVEEGLSSVDESSITGEALPRDKQTGDEVYSGTLNGTGLLRIRVERAGGDTALARVVQLVEQAREDRAPVQRLADRYATFFLPALLLSGALTFCFTGNWLRTVAVLIVACPCALILATPTAMVAAIGGLARRGILVRGGGVLQTVAAVDTAVFDKTGTVTEGEFEIVRIVALDRSEDGLLALAATVEQASTHALARVIVAEAARRGLSISAAENARVWPGRGVECGCGGHQIHAGSDAFLAGLGIVETQLLRDQADRLGATAVLIAEDGHLAGAILLRDRVRPGAAEAIATLRRMGIAHQVMLTGDRARAAHAVAREIGLSEVETGLLPEQKLDRIRRLAAEGRTVAMMGDGINDAPALAAAAVGVAIADASDLAAESAGVVYLPRSLDQLPRLFETGRQAMRTAWLNIVLFAGALNALAVLACATGKLGPIGAAVTHQLSSFCVMMNSLRLLRVGGPARFRLPQLPAAWSPARIWLRMRGIRPPSLRRLLRPVLTAGGALLVLNGFYAIGPSEVGVIQRFGRKVTPFSPPGLHYKLPWPVERLSRVQTRQVRVVEIGFRTNAAVRTAEPAAYEWNVQHRGGRYQSRPDESVMLTGDQNLIDLNAAVHYDIARPDDFLFRQLDGDSTVRVAAESVIHGIVSATALDAVLTTGRSDIEQKARAELQRRMDAYDAGIRVLHVALEDVHPSLEVVDAFREVSAAFEEKNRVVNEAEAYRNEQLALARGNAQAQVQLARAYSLVRTRHAEGDAGRFEQAERAFRGAPQTTGTRLYLETIDQVLPGRKKLIVDSGKGRRHLLLLEDGVEIAPAGPALAGVPSAR